MSTYNLFGYNYLTIPRFDFMLKLESGTTLHLSNTYMKYFAIFCLVAGISSLYQIYKRSYFYFSKFSAYFSNQKVNKSNYVIILGFGDSEASIKFTKYFSDLGYKLLVLNNKKIIDHRIEHDLNKAQEIDKLKGQIIQMNYEEFLEYKDIDDIFLNKKIENSNNDKGKIEFIFDCSILRVFTLYNQTVDKEIIAKNQIFYSEELTNIMKSYFLLFDLIKFNFENTKIFLLDYVDKEDDVNHKLMTDLKFSLFKNYLEIYKDTIFTVKRIKLNNIHGRKIINDKDLKNIHKFAHVKEQEFTFI